MKIKYRNKRIYANLILGLVWIGIYVFSSFTKDKILFSDYLYLIVGLMYLGIYFYEYFYHYLTIENGTIKKNSPFGKQIHLNEIIWIKKFAGDYTLTTKDKKLRINTELIEKQSLIELNTVLENIQLPADKTPFTTVENV
ncbi:hypothetical protein [Lacinutrix salivirga]